MTRPRTPDPLADAYLRGCAALAALIVTLLAREVMR